MYLNNDTVEVDKLWLSASFLLQLFCHDNFKSCDIKSSVYRADGVDVAPEMERN